MSAGREKRRPEDRYDVYAYLRGALFGAGVLVAALGWTGHLA